MGREREETGEPRTGLSAEMVGVESKDGGGEGDRRDLRCYTSTIRSPPVSPQEQKFILYQGKIRYGGPKKKSIYRDHLRHQIFSRAPSPGFYSFLRRFRPSPWTARKSPSHRKKERLPQESRKKGLRGLAAPRGGPRVRWRCSRGEGTAQLSRYSRQQTSIVTHRRMM